MPYVTAITDRAQTDIDTHTSKAYFNVADWDRIEDNSVFVKDELVTQYGPIVAFTGTTSAPAITTIPDVSLFNQLLGNIEYLRQAALSVLPMLASETGFTAIKFDWEAGADKQSPNYLHVNQWEKVIDIVHARLATYTALRFRYPRTGVAMANSGLTWNNRFRG
jgi:hypothetical protein